MSSSLDSGFAGDATPTESLDALQRNPSAQLIDVRTTAEWAYVGSPDLSSVARETIRIEWQVFPAMTVNADFVETLGRELAARGLGKDAPLYFLCRSGVRSKAAAIAMTSAGYSHCYNVVGGFEGPHDAERRRGAKAGWKADGLPWIQP